MYQRTSSYLCSKMKQITNKTFLAVIQDNKMELKWNDKLCDPGGATLTIQVHAINFQNGNNNRLFNPYP